MKAGVRQRVGQSSCALDTRPDRPMLARQQGGDDHGTTGRRSGRDCGGSDGGGGWQTLDRPLRTVTTVDRFALVEPGATGHSMRMLQVPELKKAMGFRTDYLMNQGTRRQNIKILGNGVCPPVMQAIVNQLRAS